MKTTQLVVYSISLKQINAAINVVTPNIFMRIQRIPPLALTSRCLDGCAQDIGTHSIRKDAATFSIAGNTAGPSIVNVCIRCGWTLGHVVERYIHYDGAGDQYVGRVIAGLSLRSSEFACLPPHFVSINPDCDVPILQILFPSLWSSCPRLHSMLSLCLASLVYHSEFLTAELPSNHQLLSTLVFTDIALLSCLRLQVKTHSDEIFPTGIPPHIAIHSQMENAQKTIQEIPALVAKAIEQLLEEKGIGSGNLTKTILEETLANAIRSITSLNPPRVEEQASRDVQLTMFNWGGRWRRLPESFVLPAVDLALAWRMWWYGSASSQSLPFRQIEPLDLTRKQAISCLIDAKQCKSYLICSTSLSGKF
ncbi:hypothetical protein Ae201684P_008889 [Aphanomyces euteiches]|uniref:Uncharacterized protein n=1 Tax=Aphanomyces euteiches TaxID=100861 RepID=A0A6G0XNM1_9STRA|nr:hypothetical protein Ae201684_002974 [Aphanomyces euteiches]KAH9093230.1 hypothetical protein Ae201684P_008889 [Aphanomyces euteiches]